MLSRSPGKAKQAERDKKQRGSLRANLAASWRFSTSSGGPCGAAGAPPGLAPTAAASACAPVSGEGGEVYRHRCNQTLCRERRGVGKD